MKNTNTTASNSGKVHVHPFKTFAQQDTTTLILGTFPGKDFTDPDKDKRKEGWYYGAERNEFWDLMEYALGCKKNTLKAMTTEEKQKVLTEHKIGITDIIKTARRKQNNNLDINLVAQHINNLNSIIKQCKEIHTIVLTSKDMYTRFFLPCYVYARNDNAFLRQDKNKRTDTYEKQGKKINIYYYTFEGRSIRVVPLHSPARKNVSIKIKKALYKHILKDNK